jgi:hypothetical protein
MTTFNRWCLVALGVILVVAVPVGLRNLPARDSDVSATALLATVAGVTDKPYSGLVQTQGTLQLPVASRFTDIGALLGESTRMRVWWRDADAWRVDKLLVSGETDLVHDGDRTTQYDYQDARATTSRDPSIRLPRTADLLPPTLARRLLEDVDPEQVTRLPARRVAGVSAPGLRLVPGSQRSSIDHVDLWADPGSGVTLRIEVYAAGAAEPGFTAEFRDFSSRRPDRDRVTFEPTAGTDRSFDDVLDIADAANQYAPFVPPDTVAGLAMSSSSDGAVGVYGTGLTQLIAIPLRGREAEPLRAQILRSLGVVTSPTGSSLEVGPLGVMLTGAGRDGGWLITGSVTAQTLTDAAVDLLRGTVLTEER